MNIAIVSPWAISDESVGGTERYTIDLATQLSKHGDLVQVFMLSGTSQIINGVQYTSLDLLGHDVTANEYDLKSYVGALQNGEFYSMWGTILESKIDVEKFDVIQLNSLLFLNAWTTKPRIITIHTNLYEFKMDWGQARFNYATNILRSDLPNKTRLVAPSDYYSKAYADIFRQPVTAIPHAIDLARLAGADIDRTSTNDDTERDITILLPSRLELSQKRPDIIFEAVSILPDKLKKLITIVASGKDDQYNEISNYLNDIALNNGFKARFCRFKTMFEAYALADIVALPSKSESFGYAALEALSLGIPTILNQRVPTFKEIAKDNKNAYFFNQSAEQCSVVLTKVIQDMHHYPNSLNWTSRYDIRQWGMKYQQLAESVTK